MSAVARLDEMGKPVAVPNSEGDNATPSVVLFESKSAKVVGKVAKQSAVANPELVRECVKNDMGTAKAWSYFGENYTAEDISAIILKRLKEDAEQVMGEPIEGAVITVPAIFGDAERNATKTAGRIAGLNVLALLEEPVAAALAYGLGRDTAGQAAQNVLVYDLGGGTFDLTVMHVAGDEITMLSTDGDRCLGGRDWDSRIVEYVAETFKAEHGEDPAKDSESHQDLINRAEDAKKALSRKETTHVVCQYSGKRSRVELTRSKFNELTAGLLDQTEATTQSVVRQLQSSRKLPGGWTDINKVLLVGGSTRMLQVPEMLARISGKVPEVTEVDLVVAQGAALYSVMKVIQNAENSGQTAELDKMGLPAGVEELLSRKEVTRVCSFAVGVAALDDTHNLANSVMIERNSELPAEGSEVFGTAVDDQREVRVQVYEGEEKDLKHCIFLGDGFITSIPAGLPQGSPVQITFKLTADGDLDISAAELTHGKQVKFQLKREIGKSEAEISVAAKRLAQDVVG